MHSHKTRNITLRCWKWLLQTLLFAAICGLWDVREIRKISYLVSKRYILVCSQSESHTSCISASYCTTEITPNLMETSCNNDNVLLTILQTCNFFYNNSRVHAFLNDVHTSFKSVFAAMFWLRNILSVNLEVNSIF